MNLIILAIQKLLKDSISALNSKLQTIKNVYYWDPFLINNSSLPAIAIQPINSEYIMRGSRYDWKIHTIEIRVIYNLKDVLSTDPSVTTMNSIQNSILMMEDTNEHETINNTICWLIQKNPLLPYNNENTCEIAQITNVSYTFSELRWFPTYEVVATVNVRVVWKR